MDQDTSTYDTLAERPLPKWLSDQRDGLNTVQPVKREIKEDKTLSVSFALTGLFVLLFITILTIYILRNKKNNLL